MVGGVDANVASNHIGYITLVLWLLGIYGNVNHLALGLSGFTAINPRYRTI